MQTKHFFKQKAILGYSIACVILLIVFFCIARCTFLRKSVRIIYDETILPCKTVVNPCNQQQSEASVWMNVIDDKLYFYPHCGSTLDRSVYDGYLSVFDKGYVKKIHKLHCTRNCVLSGSYGNYLYYWDCHNDRTADLYSFDCVSGEDTLIYSDQAEAAATVWYANDGTAYLPLFAHEPGTTSFLHVSGAKVLGTETPEAGFALGEFRYKVECGYSDNVERIVQTSPDGEEKTLALSYARKRFLIPTKNGLLIHNFGGAEILYLIEQGGSCKVLFSRPCLTSRSCVTVVGDAVYLSVLRYEKYSEIGMKRFENDTEEGTYRINLNDGTTVKLSNQIYDGLYCFDQVCLYACDENCNIYQLDLDGKQTAILLEVLDELSW